MDSLLPYNTNLDLESYLQDLHPVSPHLKLQVFHYSHFPKAKNDIPYERIYSALSTMQFSDNVYVQFWACVDFRSTCVLTTRGQPFALSMWTNEYWSYRIACLDHNSYVHRNERVCIGLPGRVFLSRCPEWTQDVRNYSEKLYPQRQDAEHSNIQGSIVGPLSEGDRCYGVLELVMTSFKNTCSDEIHEVCRAFKEEGFESWDQNGNINLNTWEDYSPRIDSRNTTIGCRNSKSRNITCNDITKLLGLPKAVAAKRCGISSEATFTGIHKTHGINEWPCMRSGVVNSSAHTALVYERAFDQTGPEVARLLKEINSRVMQDNDVDINCDDNLVEKYKDDLNSLVGKRVREQNDNECADSVLLELYNHNNKRLRK